MWKIVGFLKILKLIINQKEKKTCFSSKVINKNAANFQVTMNLFKVNDSH